MDNQHKLIKGYRDLTENEIALMNKIKEQGTILGELVATLEKTTSIDQQWVAVGKTELQMGLMAITRAVAQPTSF